jgi:ribonucleotide monophosphatase NagD (HAD superfamily)
MEFQQNPEKIGEFTGGSKVRLPGIAIDIDGVALRGSMVIGNSDKMVR